MIHKSLSYYLSIAICISSFVYGMEEEIKKDHQEALANQLVSASWDNKIDQVKKLLEEPGIDINLTDRYGDTALSIASRNGNFGIVELLINKGANVNLRNENRCPRNMDRWTPLVQALNGNHLEIAEFLIKKGASVNLPDDDNCTRLMNTSHPEIAELLLKNKANINFIDNNKWTALHFAAYNNELNVANVLLQNGADINLKDNKGETARALAAKMGHTEVVAAIDLAERTSLIKAVSNNNIEEVKKLLEVQPKININFIDCYGDNALRAASILNNFEIVELLINKGANVNLRDEGGWTPLIHACNRKHLAIAEFLIKKGANVNLLDDYKRTALMLTSHPEVAELLLKNEANINLTAHKQWTALHFAAYNNELRMAKVLLQNDAEITHKDNNGKTARDIAQHKGYFEIVDAIDLEMKERESLVNLASQRGYSNVRSSVKFLN